MRFRVFLVVFLLVFLAITGWAESVDEQEKLRSIQVKLKEGREILKQTKEQQQSVLGRLVEITHELRRTGKRLKQAEEKIIGNEVQIGALSVELRRTNEDLQQKSTMLQKRIREAYKSSGASYLDLIFDSRSMSDFISRLYYFEKVIGQDAGLITVIKDELETTRNKKNILKERNKEIKELAQVIADQKTKIAQQAEDKKKALEQLKQREREYEEKIAEMERSSRELETLIQKKIIERGRQGLVSRGSGQMIWPLRGRITSRFGAYRHRGRHTGLDVAASYGSPIVAADSGEVIFSGWWDGYGKALVIDHGKGLTTVYAHMSRIYLQVGDSVAKGQTVGLEGNTGYSTGPHLHFEVRKNGKPVNPAPYLP